jgi:2-polyprenyl-3-methyl-5-hydroxy-6-metoxy-1,4-benzoquinol methylase
LGFTIIEDAPVFYRRKIKLVNLTQPRLPANAQEIIERRNEFSKRLAEAKQEPLPLQLTWYPYDSMASIDHIAPFLRQHFADFERAFRSGPAIDFGCGDGDIPLFFASLGYEVAAADNPPNNHNWMAGVRALRDRLNLPVEIHELDADTATELPGKTYGLAISLGVLYHLKNPYLALETLAKQARYCVLSTRVADVTKSGVPIKNEPLAYLLDHRETNDDPTNQWIFSPTGLERIVKRSGWRIIDQLTRGCTQASNPTDLDKDARKFLFMRSRRLSAPATVRLLEGWTEVTELKWAWTLKRFSFEVTLLDATRPPKFSLQFLIPDVIAAASPVVKMSCSINGQPVGTHSYSGRNEKYFEADLPSSIDSSKPIHFEFTVDHRFKPLVDSRDLGIIIPFDGAVRGISEKINFWLD